MATGVDVDFTHRLYGLDGAKISNNWSQAMPKLKTKRAAAKRFKKTGNGKFVFNKPGHSHLLTHKTRKRKRYLKKDAVISDHMKKQVQRMLPYL